MSEIFDSRMMPVLALRGLAIYPEQTVHFDVGRMKSVLALEAAMKHDQVLFLVPQKDILVDDPELSDLYSVGTVVKVKQILKSHNENIRVLVTGLHRAKISNLIQSEPYLSARVDTVESTKSKDTLKEQAMRREAIALYASSVNSSSISSRQRRWASI